MIRIISICAILIVLLSSCAGPSISKDKISKNWDREVQTAIHGLYGDTIEAIRSMRKLGKMGARANDSIPFLISMLGDKRRAIGHYKGFKVRFPVGTEAAVALAKIGKSSLKPALELLKDKKTSRYYRGNIAWILKTMKGKKQFLKEYKGKEWAQVLIDALAEAMDTSDSTPAEMYYITMSSRGGIFTLIESVGIVGDKRAIPLLKKIISDDDFSRIEKDNAMRALELL